MISVEKTIRPQLILWVLLIVAGIARVVGLDSPLWFDEHTTIVTHLRLPWSEMLSEYSMNHHYLFSFQSKLFMEWLGEDAWVIRLPSFLFGIGIVWLTWVLAAQIANHRIAAASSILVALSYHQVWFSQNARGYTELGFWCLAGLIMLLKAQKTGHLFAWLGLGLAFAAATFTHLTGAFFFAAIGIVWLMAFAVGGCGIDRSAANLGKASTALALGLTLTAAAYAPLLPSMSQTIGGVGEIMSEDPLPEYLNPIWTLLEGVQTAFGSAGPVSLAFASLIGVFLVMGMIGAARIAPLLVSVFVAHFVVTVAALMFLGMRIWPRFFFVDIAIAVILLVIGLDWATARLSSMSGRKRMHNALFSLGMAFALAISVGMLARNYSAPKQDLDAAVDWIEAHAAPAARTYAAGPAYFVFDQYFETGWKPLDQLADYREAIEREGDVYIVAAFPERVMRTIPEMDADIGTVLEVVAQIPGTLGDGYVLILRRPPTGQD